MSTSRVPLSVQIAQRLRQDIRSGTYTAGDILPGELALASRYGVSPDTVRRAVRLLREEETVRVRRGIGNIVQAPAQEQVIVLGPGDSLTSRLPTAQEAARLGAAEGVWVWVVSRRDGRQELYDANRTRITG